MAVIKVGAATESAQKELKSRVEDAVHATKAAMEEGILDTAREAPLKAIVMNSGESAEKVTRELKKNQEQSGNKWLGFNASTNEIADLKEAGIIDPLKVVKTAFVNAVSVASNYLVIGAAMTELPEKKGGRGGMAGMPEEY